jgi:hypothetical protein
LYQLNRSRKFSLFLGPVSRSMSYFLPIKPNRARCLRFIFRQQFVSLPPLSSRNWSIESAQLPQATLFGPPTFTLHRYKMIISTLATLPITQPCLHLTSFLANTMPSELHQPPSFPFTAVSRPSSLRTIIPTVTNQLTLFHFSNNLSVCELT